MIAVGDVVGDKYVIVRLLGQGAMGVVYEARHKGTERRLAIKVIHRRLAADDALVRRFSTEARAAGRIESQHVADVLDVAVDGRTQLPYIVLEYLVGEDIDSLLQRTGPLPPSLAARIAAQACLGLEKAHAAGIVHRDVKPANLFLAENDGDERIVKVLDFGIAKLAGDEAPGTALTRTGGLVGSPLYMSPEQARGVRDLDARSDVWSLGVVLFQMLAGEAPHAAIDLVGDLLIAICTKAPPPLGQRAPWVEAGIARAVDGALQLDRDRRYASAAAFREALLAAAPSGITIDAAEVRGLRADERGASAGGAAASDAFAKTELSDPASDAMSTGDFLAQRGLSADATAREGAATVTPAATTAPVTDAPATDAPATEASATAAPAAKGGGGTSSSAAKSAPMKPSSKSAAHAASAAPDALAARPTRPARIGRFLAAATTLATGAAALFFMLQTGDKAPGSLAVVATDRGGQAIAPTASATAVAVAPVTDPGGLSLPPTGSAMATSAATAVAAATRATATAEPSSAAAGPAADNPGDLPGKSAPSAQSTIKAAYPRLRACYATALSKAGQPSGDVTVLIEIGADGRVVKAEIEKTSLPDASAQKCVLDVFRGLVFAPPAKGTARISYPIHFVRE